MDHDVNLGHEPYSFSKRDAIHIAVVPVEAGQNLSPGNRVYVKEGKAYPADKTTRGDGIVDPFRQESSVASGARFWLCLFPKTIKSLRHHWSHPSFPDSSEDNASGQEESVEWLRKFASNLKPYTVESDGPDVAYARLIQDLKDGELYGHGSDCHGLWDIDDRHELERHASNVLGYAVNLDDFEFTCSC